MEQDFYVPEGIILGCTEIELLLTQADSPVLVFPTARLHAELAVDLALGDDIRVLPDPPPPAST